MSKKYDISSNSDMRKFERDIEKQTTEIAKSAAESIDIDAECPHCHHAVTVKSGMNVCPYCGGQIDVTLNWKK